MLKIVFYPNDARGSVGYIRLSNLRRRTHKLTENVNFMQITRHKPISCAFAVSQLSKNSSAFAKPIWANEIFLLMVDALLR